MINGDLNDFIEKLKFGDEVFLLTKEESTSYKDTKRMGNAPSIFPNGNLQLIGIFGFVKERTSYIRSMIFSMSESGTGRYSRILRVKWNGWMNE